jgi:hypothetical protein
MVDEVRVKVGWLTEWGRTSEHGLLLSSPISVQTTCRRSCVYHHYLSCSKLSTTVTVNQQLAYPRRERSGSGSCNVCPMALKPHTEITYEHDCVLSSDALYAIYTMLQNWLQCLGTPHVAIWSLSPHFSLHQTFQALIAFLYLSPAKMICEAL